MRDPVELAREIGFSHAGLFDPAGLRALPEVRDMCASNRCRRYGHSWSCPPACGSLEETGEKMHRYTHGVLVQTTAQLEDDFDAENMAAAERRHKANFLTMARQMRLQEPDCLVKEAVATGRISRERYDSYCQMVREARERKRY